VLSPVKNETRTTVSDERLDALCLMAIESSLVRSLAFVSVINDSHPPRRLQQNCKPNLIVCSSRCRAMVHVLLCDPQNLHIALYSRRVNIRVCSNCNYFF